MEMIYAEKNNSSLQWQIELGAEKCYFHQSFMGSQKSMTRDRLLEYAICKYWFPEYAHVVHLAKVHSCILAWSHTLLQPVRVEWSSVVDIAGCLSKEADVS